jgi:hypothetical protein
MMKISQYDGKNKINVQKPPIRPGFLTLPNQKMIVGKGMIPNLACFHRLAIKHGNR